jgi:hypothetical protein
MTWFRRGRNDDHDRDEQQPDDDSPEQLRLRLWERITYINANAGRLPVEAVVGARDVTDTVGEVIDSAGDGELDVYAVVTINGILGDYLPTTLSTYLSLDPALTSQPGPSGRTPRAALQEQIGSLTTAADDLLAASRAHDVDALFSQGSFLRTKFTRSDLDL